MRRSSRPRRAFQPAPSVLFPKVRRDPTMPRYMLQFSYTPQAWAALAKNPANRRQLVEGMMKKLGGRLFDLYYHFGDFNGTAMVEGPDDPTAFPRVFRSVTPGHFNTPH